MTDEHIVDGIFHARLTSKRESKSGIFLTIQLTPDDFSPALAQLRAGSLLKMGWQELVDVSVQPLEDSRGVTPPLTTVPRPQADKAGIPKPKKRFEDLPLIQQCVLRCEDVRFREFLSENHGVIYAHADKAHAAVSYVKFRLGVKSRSELSTNEEAAEKWRGIERDYQNWQTDQRYPAGARR